MMEHAHCNQSEQAAVAVRDDILRVTCGHPMRWVPVHEVAHRLGLEDDVAQTAVRSAIEHGWLVADGDPPHSVRLSVAPIVPSEHVQDAPA